jgi:hypothetical protein
MFTMWRQNCHGKKTINGKIDTMQGVFQQSYLHARYFPDCASHFSFNCMMPFVIKQ